MLLIDFRRISDKNDFSLKIHKLLKIRMWKYCKLVCSIVRTYLDNLPSPQFSSFLPLRPLSPTYANINNSHVRGMEWGYRVLLPPCVLAIGSVNIVHCCHEASEGEYFIIGNALHKSRQHPLQQFMIRFLVPQRHSVVD